jgi:predicted nucleic acid-binding protein
MKSFFDSSALAKRYVDEPGSDDVEEVLEATSALGLCVISLPEVISALHRSRQSGTFGHEAYVALRTALVQDFADAEVVQLTEAVLNRCVQILESTSVPSADALHLAAALEWKANLFVSADQKQIAAARALGLKALKVD